MLFDYGYIHLKWSKVNVYNGLKKQTTDGIYDIISIKKLLLNTYCSGTKANAKIAFKGGYKNSGQLL